MVKIKTPKKVHTKRVIIATTETVPGYKIDDYLGLVWGTSVRAKFIGHDIIAILKTFIGGEVDPYTRMSNDARMRVIKKVVKNAKGLDADAVVGLRMQTAQIIPGTIEVLAYGTAVKLKKIKK